MDKQEAIEIIRTKEVWHKGAVNHIINSISIEKKRSLPNAKLVRIGDVYAALGHPAVIIYIKKGMTYAALMTSTSSTTGIVQECTSRWFAGKYITSTLLTERIEKVAENITCTYDNMKELKEIRRVLKNNYLNLLK